MGINEQIILSAKNQTKQALSEIERDLRKATGALSKGFSSAARDAHGSVKNFGSGLNSAVQNLTGFNVAQLAGVGAVGLLAKGLSDSMRFNVEYAKTVREMTQVTGLSAEETSRLIQVADDWGIEIGQLKTALGMMTKNGVVPSVDNLAKLADEYVNNADKTEFAEKAAKLLGRQWQTLIPILAKGGDALRAQADAVQDGLIMTDKAIQQAREYEVALDNLSDAVNTLKIGIGQELLPDVANFLKEMGDELAAYQDRGIKGWIEVRKEYDEMYKLLKRLGVDSVYELRKVQEGFEGGTSGLKAYRGELENAAKSAEDLKGEYGELSQILSGTMTQATVDFKMSMYDLNQEAIVLQDRINYLESKKFLTDAQRQELDNAKGKLGENQTEVQKLAAEHDKASKQIILGFVQQAAAADGVITQQEFDKIAELGKAWGLYDQETATAISNSKAYLEDGGMSVDELTGKINSTTGSIGKAIGKTRNLAEELAKLKDKKITVTVNTVHTEGGIRPGAGRAAGGAVVSGHSYVVGEKGPEILTMPPGVSGYITPNDKIGVAGGGGTYFYIGKLIVYAESGDALDLASNIAYMAEAQRAAGKAGLEFAG